MPICCSRPPGDADDDYISVFTCVRTPTKKTKKKTQLITGSATRLAGPRF
jgi:hypothetical protein